MVRWMEYEKFYRLCLDYNFMLIKAVHFGVYSENRLKDIQAELLKIMELLAADPVYVQYKPLLQEMHHAVNSKSDINSFFPSARKLQAEVKARKFVSDVPLYLLCVSALVIAGTLPKILRL